MNITRPISKTQIPKPYLNSEAHNQCPESETFALNNPVTNSSDPWPRPTKQSISKTSTNPNTITPLSQTNRLKPSWLRSTQLAARQFDSGEQKPAHNPQTFRWPSKLFISHQDKSVTQLQLLQLCIHQYSPNHLNQTDSPEQKHQAPLMFPRTEQIYTPTCYLPTTPHTYKSTLPSSPHNNTSTLFRFTTTVRPKEETTKKTYPYVIAANSGIQQP